MIDNSSETSGAAEVYNHFLKLWTVTEEDLERVFTEEELKELCLKRKCRVEIWRWNIVDDYRLLFTQSGRYQRWSEQNRLRMLSKAVNKIRPTIYKEDEIKIIRANQWKEQLKENIMSLNYWKRLRLNEPQTVLSESDEVDHEIQAQYLVNTESLNSAELLTSSQSQELANTSTTYRHDLIKANTQSENVELQKKSEMSDSQTEAPITPSILTIPINNIDVTDEDYYSNNDSEDSLDTVVFNDINEEISTEILQHHEVATEINNIYDVSTMSLTIPSQMYTQSQDLPRLQSQDGIPPNYDNFRNIIPLTSTQSQSQESEKKIVLQKNQ